MSTRLFPDDVTFLQRLLSCCGLYSDTIDGTFGSNTDNAEEAFNNRCEAIAAAEGTFDARSEGNIRSLRTDAQPLARKSLKALRAAGHDARIISGTRSYAEQNALFRQGRFGNHGPVVTRSRGGQSWHNFGLAWDIGLFRNGAYVTDDAVYRQVSGIAKIAGIEWGGDWHSFKDFPHYQIATAGQSVGSARVHFEAGGRG
jgi:peptidoglycan LD-endopeptidase CwlK